MDEQARRTARRTQVAEHCPFCGSPVGTMVKRHKTLGAYVPRWVPAPCDNPDCEGAAAPAAPHPTVWPSGHPASGTTSSSRHHRPPAE